MDTSLVPGIRGSLVSNGYAAHRLGNEFEAHLGAETRARARKAFVGWWRRSGSRLGPASSLRTVFDTGAVPVFELLGLSLPASRLPDASQMVMTRTRAGPVAIPVAVATWGAELDGIFARASLGAGRDDSPWIVGFDGRVLRLWDARHGWARSFIEFDLETAIGNDRAFVVLWALMRAEALARSTARIAEASSRHGTAVRASLRDGVRDALVLLVGAIAAPRGRHAPRSPAFAAEAFEQSLTIIYRMLFLLFAESRGLLPVWNQTYRRGYSVEALRTQADQPGRHKGIWAALQSLSRIAHAGCRAGELVIAPFNGRLFAPSRTPFAETARLDDGVVARVVLAVTTARGPRGCERIAFNDLGVEQLGAVYESVLDYEPIVHHAGPAVWAAGRQPGPSVTLVGTGVRRKSSGTFYTPREMTDHLVRHALDPLVEGRTADRILELKVLDPAMGSGAFLVAACHHLAEAYERAVVRDRGLLPGDITDDDRADYRRLVSQRCLYGVDLNPMAVQVARLSLWLATLSAGKPLTFLDHHLSVGNSLVGASLDDVASRPPGSTSGRQRRPSALPLFAAGDAEPALCLALPFRHELAILPDDHVTAVRGKERTLARLRDEPAGLGLWRRLADLWCAGWFWDAPAGQRPSTAAFADMASSIRGTAPSLPAATIRSLMAHAQRITDDMKFFHWTLEFPEVFYDADGTPLAGAGFDAVITNPPWDMVRGDTGALDRRECDKARAGRLVAFARQSGVYEACGSGHANLYQLFVERCVTLTKPGGRLGLIVPWGLASDRGSTDLRTLLLDRCSIDSLVGFDNSGRVFPIHRGVRFALLCVSPGPPTRDIACRFGVSDPAELDRPGRTDPAGAASGCESVVLTPPLLERLSGGARAFPYVRSSRDLDILERVCRDHPALASPRGWGLAFGRELNASDDRAIMVPGGPGLVVVEGKHLRPFQISVDPSGLRIPDVSHLRSGALRRAASTWRVAYRDVTGPTNQLTLIAALVPPRHITVHTALCLKSRLPLPMQAYLCAMLNSFVMNFVARLWVTTHVGVAVMDHLPAPRLGEYDPDFVSVAHLALALRENGEDRERQYAELQARVARLFRLTRDDFVHVLESFPLVSAGVRRQCVTEWDAAAGQTTPARR